jgi:tetratricopeptide (TPR) repeat protein
MECIGFNNLPLSVIQPSYTAYEVDTLVEPQVPRLAQLLFKAEERKLRAALGRFAEYDDAGAQAELASALALTPGYPEAFALAGMLALREGRFSEAAKHLSAARKVEAKTGILVRRLMPTFRILLRISRLQLFPVYPDYYGVSIMLAVALWKAGESEEAQRVLRELLNLVGWRDEMRVLAGEIHIAGGDFAAARDVLSAEDRPSRDDLDVTTHILRALAELACGDHHRAAITLKNDAVYIKDRNPYLTTLAKFVYSHAMERDGLPVLALRESYGLRLKRVLNPDVRNYILWREAKLKKVIQSLSGDRLLEASEFNWVMSGEKVTEQSVIDVLPPELKVSRRVYASPPRTDHERMRRLDEMFRATREYAQAADGEEVEDEEQEAEPVPDFDTSRVCDWSISRAGDSEVCFYDFRGMREPPEALTTGEKRLKRIEEAAAVGGGILLLLLFMKACF